MEVSPLETWLEHEGRLLRLRLNRPKANIVDAQMIAALAKALEQHVGSHQLAAVLLDAEGPHFSFGASVEEHLPDQCADMLSSLHSLIKQMLDFPAPILVAIQGQCLGGGLEVACGGDLLFAHPEAKMGQPEIKLGVFAPAASCLLPEKISHADAQDLLWSGRSVDGSEALGMGLVQKPADDPVAEALSWIETHLLGASSCSLRFAVKAANSDRNERIKAKLDSVEKLYLEGLMATHDAVEGLQAFVEKRATKWEHR